MKIAIDAGHGVGDRNGAVGPTGLKERDVNLMVSWLVYHVLKKEFDITMTRPTEFNVSLGERAAHANRMGCDIFLSIHCNAYNKKASGIETWHYPGSKSGEYLASCIQRNVTKIFPLSLDRGLKTSSGLAVLSRTNMPAALVELEFIDVLEMEKRLRDNGELKLYAKAMAEAIRQFSRTN